MAAVGSSLVTLDGLVTGRASVDPAIYLDRGPSTVSEQGPPTACGLIFMASVPHTVVCFGVFGLDVAFFVINPNRYAAGGLVLPRNLEGRIYAPSVTEDTHQPTYSPRA